MKSLLRRAAYATVARLPAAVKAVVVREVSRSDVDKFRLFAESAILLRVFQTYQIDCIFDVGANSGQYAGMLRSAAKFQGRIISFEPIPELAAKLRAQAADDPLWTVEECALADDSGTRNFNVMASDQMSSLGQPTQDEASVYEGANSLERVIEVRVERLRDVYPRLAEAYGFERPFLKMDTQGYDLDVVHGAGPALQNFYGLQSELAFKRLYAGAPNYHEAIEAFAELGFEASALFTNNLGAFPQLIEMDGVFLRKDIMSR